jgi:glutamate transport system substrate-binding protein
MKMRPLLLASGVAILALTISSCGKDGTGGSTASSCGDPAEITTAQNVHVTDSAVFDKMKARGHVVVGVKADQPGLSYKDASGNRCGFDFETARLLSAGLGFDPNTVEYKEIPSANREVSIQAGEVDYYVGSYSITPPRLKQILFAGPYLETGQSVLVRKDDDEITGKDSLRGHKVCGATGTNPIQLVKDQGLTEPENVIEFKTGSECLSQMLDGNVDAVTTDDAILKGWVTASPDDLKVVGEPFTFEQYGIGLALSNESLRDEMNRVLDEALNDGTWDRLYDSTLGKSGVPAAHPTPGKY